MFNLDSVKGVFCQNPCEKALLIAKKYNLPLVVDAPDTSLYIYVNKRIGLYHSSFANPFFPLYKIVKKEPIHQAIGKAKSILDITAGWGVDADKLRQFDKSVTLVEQNPLIYLILKDTLDFYGYKNEEVINSESSIFLKNNTKAYDAIYFDPMRGPKKRANGKSISLIQKLAFPDDKWEELLYVAKTMSPKVILKTPCFKSIPKPTRIIKGVNTHFAIYES